MSNLLLADAATIFSRFGINLGQIKAHIDGYIVGRGPELAGNLIAASVIFFVGKWIAKLLERFLKKLLERGKVDETLSRFLCRIAYAVLMCAVVLASLQRLGVDTTSLTAVLAAAGLAIGLAMQSSLSNFAAGIMIILFRPFKVGDFIEAAGTKGSVDEIHIFSTIMRTGDNARIIVPNSSISNSNVTNFSAHPTRRIDLVVGCGYEDDLRAVRAFLEQMLADEPRVLSDPAPVVAVSELADHCVNFVVRPWVKSPDYWPVRWTLTEQIKSGFDAQGFHIPYPQRDIHIYQEADAAQARPPLSRYQDTAAQAVSAPIQPRRVG